MSTTQDELWRKYDAACHTKGATDEQRRFAFDQWWKPEKADAMATKQAEQQATKREQSKAAHA